MTKKEMREAIREAGRLSATHRAEAIALLCDTGLSQSQARKIWHFYVLKESSLMEGVWNTQLTQDSLNFFEAILDGK